MKLTRVQFYIERVTGSSRKCIASLFQFPWKPIGVGGACQAASRFEQSHREHGNFLLFVHGVPLLLDFNVRYIVHSLLQVVSSPFA
jgi:hypothetical protein